MPKYKYTKPRALREGDKINFNTLLKAAAAGDLALLSSVRKSDGAPVTLVCAVNRSPAERLLLPVPIAVLVEGNPYKLFEDPTR